MATVSSGTNVMIVQFNILHNAHTPESSTAGEHDPTGTTEQGNHTCQAALSQEGPDTALNLPTHQVPRIPKILCSAVS